MLSSKENLEFRDSVREFFKSICDENYLRASLSKQPKLDMKLWSEAMKFGFREFFESNEDPLNSTALVAIIAKEVGRSLLPLPILSDIVVRNFLAEQIANKNDFLAKLGNAPVGVISDYTSSLNIVDSSAPENPVVILSKLESSYFAIVIPPEHSCRSAADSLDLLSAKEIIHTDIFSDSNFTRFPIEKKTFQFISLLSKLLTASQLAGMGEYITERTLEYVKFRKQFSVELSSFQVVQHKLVDMHVISEASDSLTTFAAWAAINSEKQFKLASHAAINYTVREVINLIESAIQVHGGIGFTWDYFLHWYLRRAQFLKGLSQSSASEVLKAVPL